MPVSGNFRILLLAASFLMPAACSENPPHKNRGEIKVICKCVGISDGDTITVITRNRKQYKIRLAHIDCPEKGQPYGNKAKQFSSGFCFGKVVTVIRAGKNDRNGRIIGVVLDENGENLNQALVAAGLAWHFKKYSDDQTYARLEETARREKYGLWQDADPVAPWEWRKRR